MSHNSLGDRVRWRIAAALLMAVAFAPSVASAQTVTLGWDASAGAAGYVVQWGTSLGSYPNSFDAGANTSATITGLVPGSTYWAVAKAYASNGAVSDPSTPLQFVAPLVCSFNVSPANVSMASGGGPDLVSVTASSSLCSWSATTSSPMLTVDNASHSGSGNVTLSLAPNYSTMPITATATIAGQTFNFTEAGAPVNTAWQNAEHARADVDGDGHTDLLWQDTSSGARATWLLPGNPTTRTAAYLNPGTIDVDWEIVGSGDFNGDGKPDLVWHNKTRGSIYLWYMNGVNRIGDTAFSIDGISDTRWHVVAVADFNGDGHPDILWQHDTLGWLACWFMNGTTLIRGVDLTPNQVDVQWKIVGAGDFNGDGQPDLVWWNSLNGSLGVWLMNGTTRVSFVALTPDNAGDLNWHVESVIDVNGDQTPDLVWRHQTRGAVAVWYMDGTFRTDAASFPVFIETTWKIAGPK